MVSRAKQAKLNKRMGSKFEAVVRESLANLGYFTYVKGVSTKGIDILALGGQSAI